MKSINMVAVAVVVALLLLTAGLSFAFEEPDLHLLRLAGEHQGYGGRVAKKPPACCDDCFCIQPDCRCLDYWRESCPENYCKNCVVLPPRLDPPFVQCDDVFHHSCGPRCSDLNPPQI